MRSMDGAGGSVRSWPRPAGRLDRPRLIASIVQPSAEIAPMFVPWRIARNDGTIVQGLLVRETIDGGQVYADRDGQTVTLKPEEIAERRPESISIMPEDLAHTMTPREFRDLLAFLQAPAGDVPARADNALSDRERADGWVLLFDGKTLDGWMTSSRGPSRTPVEDGCINPHGCGGYMMIHEREWSDFALSLDFKLSEGCNSGVFVRTFPLEPRPGKDVGYNGIEVALDDTQTAGPHDTGALYDLVPPSRNAMKPAGQWNHLEVTCDGPRITVAVNGEVVTRMNLDEWTKPNVRPDGTPHKFDVAYKDHPRHGYIGLQDHGAPCWFKNIKIRPISPERP